MKATALLALSLVAPALAQGDDCSTAAPISGEGTFAWDNTGMTTSAFDGGSAGCWGPATTTMENDVFFVWTAQCDGDYSFITGSATVGLVKRSVHFGNDCNATCFQGIDDSFFNPFIWVFNMSAGDQLLIQIGGSPGGSTGSGILDVVNMVAPCPPSPTITCDPAQPHYLGGTADLSTSTLGAATPSGLHLECTDGPAGEFGFFLVSSGDSLVLPVFQGILCLDAPQGRYNPSIAGNQGIPALNSIGVFDAAGVLQNLAGNSTVGSGFDVPTELPFSPVGQVIIPGSSWSFQCWFRDLDAAGAPSANFSNVATVVF